MNEARIIKRYANRKLYDTQHSRYVTLDQISDMIRNGDDVKIIDNKTKEDLTKVTLAQIIFEEEKKQRSFLSLQTMRNIIQNGGESLSHLMSEAQRRVTSILPLRKDDSKDDDRDEDTDSQGEESAMIADAVVNPQITDSVVDGGDDSAGKRREGLTSLRELREWVQQTQHSIEEWHRRVDDRIRHMVEGFSPFSGLQRDVKVLRARLAELEAKLAGAAQSEGRSDGDKPQGESARKSEGNSGSNGGGKPDGVVVEMVKESRASEPVAVDAKPVVSTDAGN